jgi:hypothetical protein
MDNVIAAFILITLLLFVGLSLFQGIVQAQDGYNLSLLEMEERLSEQARTELSLVNAEVKNLGTTMEITLKNDGTERLSEFDDWDLIVHHYSAGSVLNIAWMPYVNAEPLSGQWTVVGIYMDAAMLESEVYEPEILNSGEELLIRLRVDPAIETGTTGLVVLSTENGVVTPVLITN